MPYTIVRQDITKMKVDAIVNAANTDLKMGGGVCGAIFRAAGEDELQAACDKLAPIKTGEATITPVLPYLQSTSSTWQDPFTDNGILSRARNFYVLPI